MWTYFQVRSYVNNATHKRHFTRDLMKVESVCLKGEQVLKTTSVAYEWLQNLKDSAADRFRERWPDSLDMIIMDSQWKRACIMAHKCSLSTRFLETAYKVLTHWYVTPEKIHKWFPQSPDTCWRCNKEKGTLLHIWWQCERIIPFWNGVTDVIHRITETKLILDAACCLLHISNFTFKRYKNSLCRHLLNAAKSLIPLYWKSTTTPTMKDWLHKISYISEMEDTKVQTEEKVGRYHETWSPWFTYRYSQDYEKLIGQQGL